MQKKNLVNLDLTTDSVILHYPAARDQSEWTHLWDVPCSVFDSTVLFREEVE